MGFGTSKAQKALEEAKNIREDLYLRINNSKVLYRESFEDIREDKKEKIMISSAAELAELLDENWTTSVEVLFVFIERVCTVGVQCNYVLDEIFEEALEEGRKCDRQRKRDNWKKKCWKPGRRKEDSYPPFFGVPTSIKECILFKGRQTYVGAVSKINPIPEEDNIFTMMVKNIGLIPFVRSNVPQVCKTMETNNNIFGYCLNPWNKERSCGGSSGGQSGMVSSYCAPIGLGSDIGGSLRCPAVFTGLTTLKTGNRISRKGNCFYGKFIGGVPIKSQLGAITRSVEDQVLFNEFFFTKKNYENIPLQLIDPYLTYKPFNIEVFAQKPKFRIGLMKHLETTQTSKPNLRVTLESVQILRTKGHEIMEVKLPDFQKLFHYLIKMMNSDGQLAMLKELVGHEPLTKQYKLYVLLNKMPWLIKKILYLILRKRKPRIASLLLNTRPFSAKQVIEEIYELEAKIAPKIYQVFARNKLDCLIMPAFGTPAPRLGTIGKLQNCYPYFSSWNTIYYPAGCLPVSVVKHGQTDYSDGYNDLFTKGMADTLKGSEGLPLGVQVVSTPYNEEKVLYIMSEIEEEVRFREKYKPDIN